MGSSGGRAEKGEDVMVQTMFPRPPDMQQAGQAGGRGMAATAALARWPPGRPDGPRPDPPSGAPSVLSGCGDAAVDTRTPAGGKALTFQTEDGLALSGTSFGAGVTGVVLAHMYPADQSGWFSFAQRLGGQGYRALTFDFRGYGESEREKDIGNLDRDVEAAVAEIQALGAEQLVLIGASMGGTAGLIAAASEPVWPGFGEGAGAAGVVTLSAPLAFRGLDARAALPDVRVPVLLLAAEGDQSAVPDAQAMAAQLGGRSEVVVLSGDRHGTDLLSGPEGEQVAARILAFIEELQPVDGAAPSTAAGTSAGAASTLRPAPERDHFLVLPPPGAAHPADPGAGALAPTRGGRPGARARRTEGCRVPNCWHRWPRRTVMLCVLTDRIDDDVLEAAGPRLRVVSTLAVGFDNIDVESATRRGVLVANTPGVLTEATADLAWALILAVSRRVVEGDRFVRAGAFSEWTPTTLLGHDVFGRTLGIVGMGRIGRAVASRAVGFGMRVLYTRRSGPLPPGAVPAGADWQHKADLEGLLRAADIVSLHVPLTPETHHLVGERELALLRPGAVLVNTARGPVVDEAALVEALCSGRSVGGGAGRLRGGASAGSRSGRPPQRGLVAACRQRHGGDPGAHGRLGRRQPAGRAPGRTGAAPREPTGPAAGLTRTGRCATGAVRG